MIEEFPQKGRLAGIDFGTVRIGVAMCDPAQTMASPYENYSRKDELQDGKWYERVFKQERVVGIVLGLPVHLSGQESQKSVEVQEFGRWLAKRVELPVTYFDERFSSAAAEELLQFANLTNKRRKARRDMLAAQIILQTYLDTPTENRLNIFALSD
ncbi:MAG: Holliday junction resolvase RuvX [Pirellulaceae bacterium]|nr:Holliday junction resolvase RuvX [Pirellulaceae bacterium]